MGVITFNGVPSTTFGIRVETPPGYQMPAKDVGVVHIPGRSGDLIIDRGSYQNVTRSYDISITRADNYYPDPPDGDFSMLTQNIANWLNTQNYAELHDTYDPDFYRQAICIDAIDVQNLLNKAGRATITFDCKPQRFSIDGKTTQEFKKTDYHVIDGYWMFPIINPYSFDSKPIIEVVRDNQIIETSYDYTVSSGEQNPNPRFVDHHVEITQAGMIGSYNISITVNSTIMDCYCDDSNVTEYNKNPYVIFNAGFPVLYPGINIITVCEHLEKVRVTPNWWTL